MASNFNPLVPTGLVNLSVDYQNLQNNNQQLDTTFGVDHTTFSDNTGQNGFHFNIRQIPFSCTTSSPSINPKTTVNGSSNQPVLAPGSITGYGQLFQAQINDGIAADEALYFLSGGNNLTQLTRNFAPVAAINGYTFLPGGLILQWGNVTPLVGATLTNVTFPKPFTSNLFNIQATLIPKLNTSTSNAQCISVQPSSTPLTKFQYNYSASSSTNYIGIYWIAIGN